MSLARLVGHSAYLVGVLEHEPATLRLVRRQVLVDVDRPDRRLVLHWDAGAERVAEEIVDELSVIQVRRQHVGVQARLVQELAERQRSSRVLRPFVGNVLDAVPGKVRYRVHRRTHGEMRVAYVVRERLVYLVEQAKIPGLTWRYDRV